MHYEFIKWKLEENELGDCAFLHVKYLLAYLQFKDLLKVVGFK